MSVHWLIFSSPFQEKGFYSEPLISKWFEDMYIIYMNILKTFTGCGCQDKAGTMAGCAGCVGRLLLLGCLVTLASCDTNIRK